MFGLFTPRYVTEGREMVKAARKMLNYKRDLLQPEEVATIEVLIRTLEAAVQGRDSQQIEREAKTLNAHFEERFPHRPDAEIRENCEVFLVAIVIAVGVRSFFLQPFTIPTGSMQPTLNGIIATASTQPTPNPLIRVADFARLGRTYVDVVSQEEDTINTLEDTSWLYFFNAVAIQCGKQRFIVRSPAPRTTIGTVFDLYVGRVIHKGEVLAHGWVDTGDHVFVDKASYNFRSPHRGEVFVFSTAGVQTAENIMNPDSPSQFYIKRLAGLPGDVLRIDAPYLYINGALAKGFAFERVMAAQGDYHGYTNPPPSNSPFGAHYLTDPNATYHVPENNYFALGDNSRNSADSRFFGNVPQENLMGHGLFVYWPFNSHWGLIR
jgi:signal peptidase I